MLFTLIQIKTNCPLETYFGLYFDNSIYSYIDVYANSMTIHHSGISMIKSTTRSVFIQYKWKIPRL